MGEGEFERAVREGVNKRLTLNLLIQGAAQHAFLTSHYLVRDELNAIDGELVGLYDRIALAGFVQYWRGMSVLVSGRPGKFWKGARRDRRHPFYGHLVLGKYGGELAEAARVRAVAKCREKGMSMLPVVFSQRMLGWLNEVLRREAGYREVLVGLARRATCEVWGIPEEKLYGELTRDVAFGELRRPETVAGKLLRLSAAGYGGVVRGGDGKLVVVGKGWVWPLLSHELVKGTVELICLHGMGRWEEGVYREVVGRADRIEYEPWMLQVGAELWRRFLLVVPRECRIAEVVMRVARLPAGELERLMVAVVEEPGWAGEWIGEAVGEGGVTSDE